jgi:hypothetical protein
MKTTYPVHFDEVCTFSHFFKEALTSGVRSDSEHLGCRLPLGNFEAVLGWMASTIAKGAWNLVVTVSIVMSHFLAPIARLFAPKQLAVGRPVAFTASATARVIQAISSDMPEPHND